MRLGVENVLGRVPEISGCTLNEVEALERRSEVEVEVEAFKVEALERG